MQGPLKSYPSITGSEFIAQAMKVCSLLLLLIYFLYQELNHRVYGKKRNYAAALGAGLKTYEVKEETLVANKDFEVSGTGLARVNATVSATA